MRVLPIFYGCFYTCFGRMAKTGQRALEYSGDSCDPTWFDKIHGGQYFCGFMADHFPQNLKKMAWGKARCIRQVLRLKMLHASASRQA